MKQALQCVCCFPREQGKHGEVKREWAGAGFNQYIAVCRKHSFAETVLIKEYEDDTVGDYLCNCAKCGRPFIGHKLDKDCGQH